MSVGKLSNADLNHFIIDEIKPQRSDILIRPGVGEDCAAIKFGEYACVVTTDPITGATEELGKLAVHVSVNDIASSGAEPVALLMTLLCPEDTALESIQQIVVDANKAANAMNIEIIGGHTEMTNAVNRIVVSVTAFGSTRAEDIIMTGGAKSGDYLYMTKYAGLEGTAIIAKEKEEILKDYLTKNEIQDAQSFIEQISVLREGEIGKHLKVSAMHDVTEGGVLGAIYEMCEASKVGCKVYNNKFAIHELTQKICEHFNINPLKLISSGSMLMSVDKDVAPAYEQAMIEAEIPYSKIGVLTEEMDRILIFGEEADEEIFDVIEPPVEDELYTVV
ncbi:AIR synthase family protein [Fusibacter ferrireducens]|uniref:AIR synthase family protein n=1 Tax=Fusibacter ferrireducens TaxID=2785058 RepID=A0ABR9ZXP3_9FIRM|nr:AIR synthase family protein [Fusibacter ferrireducens]MBF4695232.1 AIR synthase family protein [Fusibacter ferrireducens]